MAQGRRGETFHRCLQVRCQDARTEVDITVGRLMVVVVVVVMVELIIKVVVVAPAPAEEAPADCSV